MSDSKKEHIKKDENERGPKDNQKGYTYIHIHTYIYTYIYQWHLTYKKLSRWHPDLGQGRRLNLILRGLNLPKPTDKQSKQIEKRNKQKDREEKKRS